ncbi:MAG: UDP-3-O-(3-hydroxymyristoyl)glucosamine N-acyltransferase, partial [Chitinophagales bacterium]|nr:UDP-3-O-(3-hydroxymyristoyl)glucosamine N-acyltransferase [Chitinophagales bacterium]
MQLTKPITLKDCTDFLSANFAGDANALITGINEIHKVQHGDITFVDYQKYYDAALKSAATFIIINKKVDCPPGKGLIFSDDPFRDYVKLVKYFFPFNPSLKNISDTAVIGEHTILFPGVYIGNNCIIGDHCIIHPNVVMYDNTIIGDRVIIHANTTLGSDAFYFKNRKTFYDKLESCGRTVIEDDVEVGASCTIDKGVSGDTIIGAGTKMDSHIHIGHGAVIGKMCLFAGQVGIGGKAIIGNNVILWGQVGVSKDLTIGDGAIILAQSGVGKSLEGGKTYFGSP